MSNDRLAEVVRALAANVRRRRIRLGLSQESLAEALEVSGRYVQRIEQGRAEPSLRLLVDLSRVLKVPTSALLHKSAPMKRHPGRPARSDLV